MGSLLYELFVCWMSPAIERRAGRSSESIALFSIYTAHYSDTPYLVMQQRKMNLKLSELPRRILNP